MPRIPVATERTVESIPDQTPFQQQDNFSANAGQALARGVAGLGQAFQRLAADEKRKGDTSAINNGKTLIRGIKSDVLVGGAAVEGPPDPNTFEPANGRKMGSAAGVSMDGLDHYDERVRAVIDGASNDEQRQALSESAFAHRGDLEGTLQAYENAELFKHRAGISAESLSTSLNDAIVGVRMRLGAGLEVDEGYFTRAIAGGLADRRDYLEAEGDLSADEIDSDIDQTRSKMLAAIVSNVMTDHPDQAKEMFDDVMSVPGLMSEEDAEPLRKPLGEFLDLSKGQQLVGEITTKLDISFDKPVTSEQLTAARQAIQDMKGKDKKLARDEFNRFISDHNGVASVANEEAFERAYPAALKGQNVSGEDLRWLTPNQLEAIRKAKIPAVTTDWVKLSETFFALSEPEQAKANLNEYRHIADQQTLGFLAKLQNTLRHATSGAPTAAFSRNQRMSDVIDSQPKAVKRLLLADTNEAKARLARLRLAIGAQIDAESVDGRVPPERESRIIYDTITDTVTKGGFKLSFLPFVPGSVTLPRAAVEPGKLAGFVTTEYEDIELEDRRSVENWIGGQGPKFGFQSAGPDDVEALYDAAISGGTISGVPQSAIQNLRDTIEAGRQAPVDPVRDRDNAGQFEVPDESRERAELAEQDGLSEAADNFKLFASDVTHTPEERERAIAVLKHNNVDAESEPAILNTIINNRIFDGIQQGRSPFPVEIEARVVDAIADRTIGKNEVQVIREYWNTRTFGKLDEELARAAVFIPPSIPSIYFEDVIEVIEGGGDGADRTSVER